MSTRAEPALRRLVPALAACVLLAACSSDPSPAPAPSDAGSSGTDPVAAPSATPSAGAAPTRTPPEPSESPESPDPAPRVSLDVAGDLQAVLDRRAAALVARDRAGFVATLTDDADLVRTEEGYFDNLEQLPLATFGYRVVPASLVRSGLGYWGVVEISTQLAGYDALPARSVDRVRFVPAGRSYRIASTTDPRWEATNLGVQQPWDLEPIRVREGDGVLGVFDTATERQAAALVAAAQRGVADVGARVPYDEWSGTAVFYALSDPAFLDSFDELPGGAPEAVDGVAFSVPAGTDDTVTAATRFALNPTVLARRGPALDALVRHELTHVAVGTHDDDAPAWLSEGIAEWVSVQALARRDRQVPPRALAAARRGITSMPSDAAFNGDAAAVNYALAWWVCEWLAARYGADAPWQLLDAFTALPDAGDQAVVRRVLDLSVDQLARRGSALMAATYRTEPAPPTSPPTSPPRAP